jgi:hypothetical protein
MTVLNVLRLKLLNLLGSRILIILFLAVPVLLGLVAGASNVANLQPGVRLVVIDLDQSPASRELTENLTAQGWSVWTATAAEARKVLLKHEADGAITIRAGYEAALSDLKEVRITYQAAEGSLLTNMVCEVIASEILPTSSRLLFLGQIEKQYAAAGEPVPADLAARFDADAAYYADHQARLDIVYSGAPVFAPAQSYLVSDYSMEVFFLGIYAILGTLALSSSAFRRRLAVTKNGLMIDYGLSIVSMFLLGLIQIFLYSLAMSILMKIPLRPAEMGYLAVCLLFLLSLSQLFNLIHESVRLYLGLLILLALSVGSGCFFQLSGPLITGLGQYLPQGWTLAALRGYPVLPFYIPVAVSLVLLATGFASQLYRTRHSH